MALTADKKGQVYLITDEELSDILYWGFGISPYQSKNPHDMTEYPIPDGEAIIQKIRSRPTQIMIVNDAGVPERVGRGMNIPASEIFQRCEKASVGGNYCSHVKHAIHIYLSLALYFGDINDITFRAMTQYFDEKYRIGREDREKHKL